MNKFKKYLPNLHFKLNKYIPFQNYSINYFKGGYESFGNNIQQIAIGIIYCNLNGYNFYLKKHPYIRDIKIINNNFSNIFSFFKKKYRFFYFDKEVTDFFNRNDYLNKNENDFPISEFEKEIYINNIHQTVKKFVQPNLNFKTEISIPKETLVIHIRSGDVFEKDWHSMYVQNPLSYFEKLIDQFEKIIIVSSDDKNPVINELKKNKKIIFKSSNFIDDLNILLNAEHLASSGVGTFVISAVFLSSKIKKFYCSQYYLTEHLNPEMINEIEVKKLKVDDYIDIGEFKKNDENLKKILSTNINVDFVDK